MMTNYLMLILSVVIGSIIAARIPTHRSMPVRLLLTFSGAYLLSIGVFHLLPSIYDNGEAYMGLWVMAGFFLQIILEFFSKGMEHGHGHTEIFRNKGIPVAIIASLYIHALLESMPIGSHSHHSHESRSLLWAIVVHKVPVSIILYAMVAEVFSRKWKIGLFMLGFALVAPLGVFLGDSIHFLIDYNREITAVVFGIFLHISTTILFENDDSHRFNFLKFFITVFAVLVAWFSI